MKTILDFFKRQAALFLPPILHDALRRLYWRVRYRKSYAASTVGFEGWGLKSAHYPPWADAGRGGADLEERFMSAHTQLKKEVSSGAILLSQFGEKAAAAVDTLMWRHYMVFWSARYAAASTHCREKNLAECGVCDGLTMFFALNGVSDAESVKAYLYDAWAPMKSEHLLSSEKSLSGSYSYLDVKNTKKNLARFKDRLVWNKGFIPDVFAGATNPERLVWLHIDLNSAKPTVDALEFLFDRIEPGGVILFDDFAWAGYEDTRFAVRRWCADKKGTLLPLPTGQALYFKA